MCKEINMCDIQDLAKSKNNYFIENDCEITKQKFKYKYLDITNHNISTKFCESKFVSIIDITCFKHCGHQVLLGIMHDI